METGYLRGIKVGNLEPEKMELLNSLKKDLDIKFSDKTELSFLHPYWKSEKMKGRRGNKAAMAKIEAILASANIFFKEQKGQQFRESTTVTAVSGGRKGKLFGNIKDRLEFNFTASQPNFRKFVKTMADLEQTISELGVKAYYSGSSLEKSGRVLGFFEWLNANKGQLLSEIKTDRNCLSVWGLLDPKNTRLSNPYSLGLWLGTRYAASKYDHFGKQDFPRFQAFNTLKPADPEAYTFYAGYSGFKNVFYRNSRGFDRIAAEANLSKTDVFIAGFNVGIHESTHALSQINKIGKRSLTETATAFMQNTYALPLKVQELRQNEKQLHLNRVQLSCGVSDFIHNMRLLSLGKLSHVKRDFIMREYLAFFASPWIKAYYKSNGGFNAMDFSVPFETTKLPAVTLHQIYAKEFGSPKELLEFFAQREGIKDEKVIGKLDSIFTGLFASKWGTEAEFLSKLATLFQSEFGNPVVEALPDNYM